MTEPVDGDCDPETTVDSAPRADTELAPPFGDSAYAWALDDGPEWKPPFWTPGRVTTVAVGVAVLTVVAATGIGAYHLRPTVVVSAPQATTGTQTSSSTAATTETAKVSPPVDREGWGIPDNLVPPSTKTVTVEKPAPPPPVVAPARSIDWLDEQLLKNLKAQGWTIWNPEAVVNNGRQICALLRRGSTTWQVINELVADGIYPRPEAQSILSAAVGTYPNCPSF